MTTTLLHDRFKMPTLPQLGPNFVHVGSIRTLSDAQKCNTYWAFLIFFCIQLSLLQMPHVTPQGPQKGIKRPTEEAKRGLEGAQEGPKRGPRRPQEGPQEGTPNQLGSETPPEPLWDPSGDPFRDQIGVPKGPKTPSGTLRGPLKLLSGSLFP